MVRHAGQALVALGRAHTYDGVPRREREQPLVEVALAAHAGHRGCVGPDHLHDHMPCRPRPCDAVLSNGFPRAKAPIDRMQASKSGHATLALRTQLLGWTNVPATMHRTEVGVLKR